MLIHILDTGKLFSDVAYRDRLVAKLGLEDVRTIRPDPQRLAEADPERALWLTDPDQCCRMRKVEPLAGALSGFDAWCGESANYWVPTHRPLPALSVAGQELLTWRAGEKSTEARRRGDCTRNAADKSGLRYTAHLSELPASVQPLAQ